MKIKYLLVLSLFLIPEYLFSQGCVAIRGMSSCNGTGNTLALGKGESMISTNYRYFESFRHFRGSVEETHRIEEGTNVINKSHFVDLSYTYGINNRIFATAVLPFVYHTRSSMYEHGGNPPRGLGERHTTRSQGLADARLSLGYWIFDSEKHKGFNYALAIGAKLPTGKADYTDTFYNQGPDRDQDVEAVVDQSIQPGDGGLGITAEIQGYHFLADHLMLTTNLFYMINYQETNGVLTRRGTSEFSCPDQYAARVGAFYNPQFQNLNFYIGGRLEGVPSSDLIGGSSGYRRPGYAISAEPGVSWIKNAISLNVSVPIALVRNRVQSTRDKERTASSGTFVQGDAAFADYVLNFNLFYRFGGTGHAKVEAPNWDEVN